MKYTSQYLLHLEINLDDNQQIDFDQKDLQFVEEQQLVAL